MGGDRHFRHLEQAFGRAAPDHYAWQTRAPFVSERERDLVRRAFFPLGKRVLDLGCGEGATLYHLGSPEGAVGLDLFEDKLAFARKALPACSFVAGSATELPFDAGAFDHVIVRDVIHHLPRPEALVREVARVLSPGGRLDVLEPCRNNPLILLHAITQPAERGELRSTRRFLRGLVERGELFSVLLEESLQAFPIHRLVFHPKLGRPSLAERPAVAGAVDRLERLAGKVLPEFCFAYLHLRASRA